MKVIILTLASLALVLAEPPVPNSQYLPSNTYIPPNGQYGAPAQTEAVLRPSNSYGPPSNSYGPPSNSYGPPSNAYGPPNGGYAGGRTEEATEPASYQFEYHVQDAESGNDFGHQEQREGDVAQGKYFVLLPDGRIQTVEYTADQDGYKPKITYEQTQNGGNGGYPSGRPSNGNGGYQY
ncbi:unnamed protein product [Phaedon cochleariae]|uniref:Pro-resilin n=1 Tax=Phaedon cochleariae TaxID=80249 RepID=A0A9P0DPL3_PHACE|nr:unnamed protein product [Phaedon cochleariae]